jgi:hypothetical protein
MIKSRVNDEDMLKLVYESIFSGNVDSKDEKDEDTDADTKSSDDKESKKSEDDKDDDKDTDEDTDEDADDEDSDDDSDDTDSDSDEVESEGSSAKDKSPAKSKLKALQRQYNDLLIDLFDKYAVECIENALEDSEHSFGENIEGILDAALCNLKGKILGELGVEDSDGCDLDSEDVDDVESDDVESDDIEPDDESVSMPPEAMGSFDPEAGKKFPMEISIG